jgi:hypothetical protein
LLQISLQLFSQGRTLGAPGRPAQAETREDAQDEHGERERARQCRAEATRDVGDSRRTWLGSLAASSSAIAHRRGPLPAAPMPRTPPQHAPRRDAP